MKIYLSRAFQILILLTSLTFPVMGQNLSDFHLKNPDQLGPQTIDLQFNGYTNYWHDIYTQWHRYGNIFKMAELRVSETILQSKLDIAEDLRMPGLMMQEGFLKSLYDAPYNKQTISSEDDIPNLLGRNLIIVDAASEIGKMLESKAATTFTWTEGLNSYQLNDSEIQRTKAFYLENGDHQLFVISSTHADHATLLMEKIEMTQEILETYRLEKGWFGVSSLLKSVTCAQGHPIELMGLGMNEGNSWFIFDGYMDFLAKDEIEGWVKESGLPIVANVGFSPIYGCRDYEDLQVQDMSTQAWIDYAHSKGGYAFRQVYHPESDEFEFDGYFVHEGNKDQIDNENVPFINRTGYLRENLTSSMILFIEKEKQLSNSAIWDAIMNRKSVAVLEKALVMGPTDLRSAIQLLYLDRLFLENYYHDQIDIQSRVDGYNLVVQVTNYSDQNIQTDVSIGQNPHLKARQNSSQGVTVRTGETQELIFPLELTKEAMGRTNPIAIHVDWDDQRKSTLQMLDMPPAVSLHQLLYGHAPRVEFPVAVHNFSNQSSFPVQVEVYAKDNPGQSIFKTQKTCNATSAHYEKVDFILDLDPGEYWVEVSALGTSSRSQLGVGAPQGKPYLYEVDLNSDGINEYRLENDSVQITLLRTGARVIEYIVKSKQDNVLFKIWPEKTYNHKKPFRMRGFYPYGGFEDFLGQGSMETHKIYDARIIQSEGDFVRVEMETEYYGNMLKKVFTLYGNSPLLEVRFSLDFHNPEANVLGPQPILALGEEHGTEDVFTVPTMDGLKEYRMRPEKYFGQAIHIKEGWNAGYETKEDISFIGAFPVSQPIFLHMWMNHPRNQEAPHYYVEFQPWTPIVQKTTMYFSYYLWGSAGAYEHGLKELRERNLISVRK